MAQVTTRTKYSSTSVFCTGLLSKLVAGTTRPPVTCMRFFQALSSPPPLNHKPSEAPSLMDCFNKECRQEAFDFCLGHGVLSSWVGNGLGYITRSFSSVKAHKKCFLIRAAFGPSVRCRLQHHFHHVSLFEFSFPSLSCGFPLTVRMQKLGGRKFLEWVF